MLELFDGVRIDHFRGIESYFSIPSGAPSARLGRWVKGPGRALVRAIREEAGDALIIAEDLGDITPEVYKLVEDSGFPGMRVFQFGFLGDYDNPHMPHNYKNNCVAYTGTHDNNTLFGFLWESDDNVRKRALDYCGFSGGDWGGASPLFLRAIFASVSDLAIIPVQDFLMYPNWFFLLVYLPKTIKTLMAYSHLDVKVFPENTYIISPVFVAPEHQGKGIASKLIKQGIADLTAKGYKLGLEAQDKDNVKFYEKLGFKVIKHDFWEREGIDNYYMMYDPE